MLMSRLLHRQDEREALRPRSRASRAAVNANENIYFRFRDNVKLDGVSILCIGKQIRGEIPARLRRRG